VNGWKWFHDDFIDSQCKGNGKLQILQEKGMNNFFMARVRPSFRRVRPKTSRLRICESGFSVYLQHNIIN